MGMPRKPKVNPTYKQIVEKEWAAIAKTLKTRRVELGLTQNDLAEKLEAEVTTIQAYEQRRRHPSLPTLLMLCRILRLRLSVS